MRTICKRAHRGYNFRQLYGMDSQVGLGVCSKERSPSYVLNAEYRDGAADVVGFVPGYYLVPPRLNLSDSCKDESLCQWAYNEARNTDTHLRELVARRFAQGYSMVRTEFIKVAHIRDYAAGRGDHSPEPGRLHMF